MLVFPAASREQRLRAFVRTARQVRLFTNAVLPTSGTTVHDFIEPDKGSGYVAIDLNRAAWRFEVVGPAIRAISAPVRFVLPNARPAGTLAGVSVRGHFAVSGDGELLWSELLLARVPGVDGLRPQAFEFLRPSDALEIRIMVDAVDMQIEMLDEVVT